MSSVVVAGAGAAGLMAAIFAAERADVIVLEQTKDGGRKILISGGGRCNILPVTLRPERFVTDSPAHLLRGMLRAWPLDAQRAFFEREAGIPLKVEEQTGKLFPVSGRARDVRVGLVELARRRGVQVRFETALDSLTATGHGWCVGTGRGDVDADAVILAPGGLSVPSTGSDGAGASRPERPPPRR
jgi:predicted Rossmann fold flavoprotein